MKLQPAAAVKQIADLKAGELFIWKDAYAQPIKCLCVKAISKESAIFSYVKLSSRQKEPLPQYHHHDFRFSSHADEEVVSFGAEWIFHFDPDHVTYDHVVAQKPGTVLIGKGSYLLRALGLDGRRLDLAKLSAAPAFFDSGFPIIEVWNIWLDVADIGRPGRTPFLAFDARSATP